MLSLSELQIKFELLIKSLGQPSLFPASEEQSFWATLSVNTVSLRRVSNYFCLGAIKKKKRQFVFHMLLGAAKYKNSRLFSELEEHSGTGKVLEEVTVEFSKLPTDWTSEGTGKYESHMNGG